MTEQKKENIYNLKQLNFLPLEFNYTEQQDFSWFAECNESFRKNVASKKRVFYNNILFDELKYVLNGPIPRNFVINIRGKIGRKTGIFKTSLGLFITKSLDPTFNIKERLAFSSDQLNAKIERYANRKQIFMMDEALRDLKFGNELITSNIIENCREKQLCFVLCGVQERTLTFSDYFLDRIGESSDSYLPKKTVYFSVSKEIEFKKEYRGYISINLPPLLKDKNDDWNNMWKEYMFLKDEHEKKVIKQQVTGFDFEERANRILKNKKIIEAVFDGVKINRQLLKNIIYKIYPDITNDNRKMIYTHIINTEIT